MNLKLLDIEKFTKGLTPVTSTELRTRSGEFHPEGLYSEKIFGVEGSLDRSRRYSYINLNTEVVHPAVYKLLLRLDKRLLKFFSTENTYSLDNSGRLQPDEKGVSGIREFIKLFPSIKFKGETTTRDQIIKVIQKSYKDGKIFIDKLPIIPADIRPMYEDENGTWMIDALTIDVYINIMRKATQIKSVGKGSALFNLLNFYLQNAVNDHDKFIRTKLSKKTGLIRASLLGKRIDFSARGVITPGPKLKVNEIGLPLRMAVSLFEPFILNYLLFSGKYPFKGELEDAIKGFTESDLSVDTIQRLLKSIKFGDKIPEDLFKLIFDATEIVMKDRVILAKRDPALHDGSYGAFYPILITGDTIQICTLQVGGFNADFDGDQMALFHPLSRQAQQEAKDKMMKGIGSKHSGHVTYELSKEMCVGLYTLTKDIRKKTSPVAVTPEILEKATDPYIPVRFKGKNTTMGRAIFNSVFPADFEFVDKLVTKKVANGLIPIIIDKYGEDKAKEIFSSLERIGFKFATIMAPTFTLDMITVPDSILRMKEKLEDASTEEADKLLKDMEKIMINHLKGTGLYDLVESGAGKGWGQPRQILIAKGIIADPKGNIMAPIKGSFSEGLTNEEYFQAASGARKGLADRTLNTAKTGYFTRQLVYVLSPAEASPTNRDCRTRRYITLRLTSDLIKRLQGRNIIKGGKVIKFNPSAFKGGDTIQLRTPILCESKKFCHTCYGDLLKRHKTPYVGILAGASIGERGTQLIMRTFHTGGAAVVAQHNMIKDIRDNDPLLQTNISGYLRQDEDKLVALKPCTVTIELTGYRNNDNLQINEDSIWVNHLLSKIEFEDVIFNLILDYPINLQKINMEKIEKTQLVFHYQPNDVVIEVPLETTEIKEQVNYVGRLLGGKVVYKDPGHLITKIMKVYGGAVSDLDLVHFEVLVSQVLRDRSNHALPARLGKNWNPIMMNIKSTVFESGFIQGLAFENINKAIETGLITEDMVEPSLLGNLLTGELIK